MAWLLVSRAKLVNKSGELLHTIPLNPTKDVLRGFSQSTQQGLESFCTLKIR